MSGSGNLLAFLVTNGEFSMKILNTLRTLCRGQVPRREQLQEKAVDFFLTKIANIPVTTEELKPYEGPRVDFLSSEKFEALCEKNFQNLLKKKYEDPSQRVQSTTEEPPQKDKA